MGKETPNFVGQVTPVGQIDILVTARVGLFNTLGVAVSLLVILVTPRLGLIKTPNSTVYIIDSLVAEVGNFRKYLFKGSDR